MANALPPNRTSDDFDDLSSLGKYKIQRMVGSGGMGSVYLAIDQQLKRTVALKVLTKDKAANKTLVRRFKAEGQAGAQMEHPNIVSVYESGEVDGFLYLAMEYVEGIDTFELLRKRGVIPVKRSLDIIRQVVHALEHAYARQIVHRDIKPSNLIIRERDGVVKLADMGLARFREDDADLGLTRAGTTVGTVDYMSPEQARDSKSADFRSDLYSLGCTWFHLMTGSPPYPDGDLMNKLRAHAMQPIPDPRQFNENIPAGVVSIVQRMMAKKPEDRYQTPAQLLADLSLPSLLRGDFSADKLQMLGAAHAEDDSTVQEHESEDSNRSESRRRPPPAKPIRGGNTPTTRVERSLDDEDEDDDEEEVPQESVRESGSQRKIRPPVKRDALPARTTRQEVSEESEPQKRPKSERVLPARIDKPVQVEREQSPRAFNTNFLKLGVLLLVIAAAGYGIFTGLSRLGGSSNEDSSSVNPYANRDKNVELPPQPVETPKAKPEMQAAVAPQQAEVALTPRPGTNPDSDVGTGSPTNSPIAELEVDRSPFAGNIPYTDQGTTPIPRWVWQSRGKFVRTQPRVIRRGSPREGEYRDLESAQANAQGTVVFEFADVGPHEIPVFKVQTSTHRTFRAAEGVSPVLILKSSDAPIMLVGGTLTLDGVHLVVMPDHSAPVVQVENATLVVRHSSLTHLGPQASGLIVAAQGGRVLLESSLLRGQGVCRPVTLKGTNSSLVAGQSLLVAGHASAIHVDSQDAKGDTRLVTLASSACLSGLSGIACVHQGTQLPQINLSLLGSILSYLPGHSADAIGVSFAGWPSSTESLERPRVSSVKWSAEKSAFVGWPHWAQLSFADAQDAVDIRDEEAWRAFWRQSSPAGALIPVGADLQSIAGRGVLVTGADVAKGLDGIRPQLADAGPNWAELSSSPNEVLANTVAFGQSPAIPGTLESPDPGKTVEYDLKKSGLGKFINSDQCPDGSTVVAFGFGLRTIDPFVVRQKRIQIVFKQVEGAALKIQPGGISESSRPAAWFAVEDGQLTLTNGSFLLQSTKVRSYPERFLKMSGGLVALRNCRVEGSDAGFPVLDTSPSEGHAPPQLLIEKSLVVGPGTLVRIGTSETVVEIRGSALASSTGSVLAVDSGVERAHCAVNRSTLSGAQSVFRVIPIAAAGATTLLSKESVYRGGSVVELAGDPTTLQWWGVENAYASGMAKFLVSSQSAASQEFDRDWVEAWGPGHELLPIFGVNRTVIAEPPSNLSEIAPQAFQLNATCDAALAGAGGSGVGAQVSQLGPSQPTLPKMTPAKKSPTPPRPNAPNF